jgi:hypothetical protein
MKEGVPNADCNLVLQDFVIVIFVELSGQDVALSLNPKRNTLFASSQRITLECYA